MALRARPVRAMGRVMRRPQHPFQVRQNPWAITPFMIAPVLPGETMKNLLMQARVVSDPIRNPLIGWWMEYYFFYVKHRDLEGREDFEQMMLDMDTDLSSYSLAATPNWYHAGGIPWVKLCLDRVVETYFRDEDETGTFEFSGVPIASISQQNWLDSVKNDTDFIAQDEGPDVDLDGDEVIRAGEVDRALQHWQFLKAHSLTEMDYEDYLRTFGIKVSKIEEHIPELVRYSRNWSYPSNTVDPSTGVPSSALSWAIAERADKDRFFREPGFLFGVSVARPKVYLSKQLGSATSLMNSALRWLPAIMRDDPWTSLAKVDNGFGPLPTVTDDYWVDIKDLLLYGEQFVNFALTETDAGLVGLPTAALEKRFASVADMEGLFTDVDADEYTATKFFVRQDGLVSLQIAGTQVDTSPELKLPEV